MIQSIQYLRAVAAMMVVWHHSLGQIPGVTDLVTLPLFGPSGVDLFFVISGFIMAVTTTEKPLTPREFMELRVVRVVPLYWLITLAMVGLVALAPAIFKTTQISPAAIVKSLLFIPYDSLSAPGNAWPILVPGWTLNYEMFFYLIFTLALALPSRWRLTALVLTMVSLVVAGRIAGPSPYPVVWVYTNPMLLEFAEGAVIGGLWSRRKPGVPLAASSAAIVAGFYLLLNRDQPPLMAYSQNLGAVLVVCGALHPAISSLKSRLLLLLGDASYSIYLTHIFTLGALRVIWTRLVHSTAAPYSIAFLAVALVVSAIAGVLMYRFIEKPMTNRLRSLIKSGFPNAAKRPAAEFRV